MRRPWSRSALAHRATIWSAAMVAMPIVWDERCRLHEPGAEIWVGLRDARDGGARPRGRAARGARRHRSGRAARRRGAAAGPRPGARRLPRVGVGVVARRGPPGESRPGARRPVRVRARRDPCADGLPAAEWARPGYFAYDTMTLIGPGTWEAARAAVDAALTAVDLVAGGRAARVRALPSARPPRLPRRLRRLVLPEQRRGRGRGASPSRGPGRGPRRRRAPRQRDAGDLLGPRRRPRRVGPRRSGRRLVPALPRLRGRDDGLEPQPAARAREPATSGWLARRRARQPSGVERRGARRLARRRRGRQPIPRARCG